MPLPEGPVALLGDAHLRENDAEVEAFVRFLDALPPDIRTLAILGDLFSVWVGSPGLQRRHHRLVTEALARLRRRGCVLLYVEGNHDFFLERFDGGRLFDRCAANSLDLVLAGHRTHLAHGDMVNARDRQYRAWRAVSKNRLFFAAFSLLSPGVRLSIAERLEQRLATTNMRHKSGFPLAECDAYARRKIAEGTDILVFGHFHQEKRLDYRVRDRRGSVFVLPAWRDGRRYLRIESGAEPAFVSA